MILTLIINMRYAVLHTAYIILSSRVSIRISMEVVSKVRILLTLKKFWNTCFPVQGNYKIHVKDMYFLHEPLIAWILLVFNIQIKYCEASQASGRFHLSVWVVLNVTFELSFYSCTLGEISSDNWVIVVFNYNICDNL
jgi:hypothetical protein